MIGLTVLGSTGSVGVSTLDVVARHRDRVDVFALTASTNVERMVQQCKSFTPRYAVMAQPEAARSLALALGEAGIGTEVLHGPKDLEAVAAAPECDVVMAAIVGAAGLLPTLSAAGGMRAPPSV